MNRTARILACLAVMALPAGLSASGYAQQPIGTSSWTNNNGLQGQENNERQLRQQMEQLRIEEENLRTEHEKLHAAMERLHEKEDALHERMRVVREQLDNLHHP